MWRRARPPKESAESNTGSERELLGSAIAESCHDAILVVDAEGIIEFVNSAAEKLFGCAAEEAIGQNVLRFLPAPNGNGKNRRLTAIRKDGRGVPVAVEVREVHGPKRSVFTLAIHAFTEPEDDEKELLRLVLGAARTMLLVTDHEGRIVMFNRGCEEFTEFAAAEVRGKRVGEALADPDGAAELDDAWSLARSARGQTETRCEWLTRSGLRRNMICRHEVLRDDFGLVSHIVTVASEQETPPAAPDHALAGFPDLLTSVTGYADLVLESLRDDDPIRKDVEEIKKAGDRAAEILVAALRHT